jgi:hypothetical protein
MRVALGVAGTSPDAGAPHLLWPDGGDLETCSTSPNDVSGNISPGDGPVKR